MRMSLLYKFSLAWLFLEIVSTAAFAAAQLPAASNTLTANGASTDSTVLVAWIGFAGAVIAAFIAFETYMVRKRSENNSVNRAVRAEIGRLLEVIGDHERWWADCVKRGDTNQPLIPFSHAVYTGQVKKIGVLRREFVGKAVRFYGYVDFLNSLQSSRDQYSKLGKLHDFDRTYGSSLLKCVEQFQRAFEQEDAD